MAYCNTAFAVLLKVPHQKLVGASFWDFVVAEDAERHRELVASQPSPVQSEVRLLRSDGEMLYTYVTFNSLSRASGASLGVLVTDLTFQRYHEQLSSAHQALRESEARFREIIDALPTAIYSTDAQGRLTHFNPACVEFSGRMPELGTDKWCITWKLFDADGRPMAHDTCPMAIALKEGRSLRGIEAIAERPDGTRIWFTPYPTLLRNTAGEIVGGINMLVDITERKMAEDALNQSKIALTDADRRKDEFLATLAHELRNPLAPIRNGLHIMRTELAGARVDELRDMMDRQVTHLVRLIDDLLDVSRVSQGKIDLRKQRITLQSAVEAATEASRPLIEERGHRLVLTLPDTPLWLDADLTRIAQVLGNLLNNAAKYTPEGGLITVSARSEGSDAVMSVSDNGVGIPDDMLPKVFDLFTQVDRNLERSQGGLGIGLALVRQLVAMHGGTIEAHSGGVDRGSMFTVRLPLAAVDKTATSQVARPTAAQTPPQRVLVVDDNVPAAETTGWMLEVDGHTVEYAYDA
ncbi:MAG: ATP-binding protein, partial [Pseudomonadota bacterium]|nr:ATP-binding protein [Pseudomonadota bacterium]